MFISYKALEKEQAKSLNYKLESFDEAAFSAFKVCLHRAAIAFSGGKDSTVLWHRLMAKFPNNGRTMVNVLPSKQD